MSRHGPVLAATALDAVGDEVIRQAAGYANAVGVPLVVCHVVPELYGIRPLFPHLRESDRAHAEEARRGVMRAVEQQMRRAIEEPAPPLELRIEAGTPHSGVLQLAEELEAGLIVVGAGSHLEGASLGGVAERIVRHAHCPVLTARPVGGAVVLVATDLSEPGLPAIETARHEAHRRGLRLVALHAVEVRMLPVDTPEGTPALLLSHVLEGEVERATRALREIAAWHGEEIEPLVRTGPPAEAILEVARELSAELIVVATHGRSGLRRLTLGSVAEAVVRRATCSVMVVRLAP